MATPASVAGVAQPYLQSAIPALPGGTQDRSIPQRPLDPQGKGCAYVFIGGMGDEVSGIVDHLSRFMPEPVPGQGATRAYYRWHAGLTDDDPMAAARVIAGHISTYLETNPGADVVLMGHSLGASTALKVATLLPPGQGRVFLVTLDPVDRSTTPKRPACVTWWGNAYVENSQSARDALYALGGRWSHCDGADVNLCFRGEDEDEAGCHYIHDNAWSFLMSRGAATAKRGAKAPSSSGAPAGIRRPRFSLFDSLRSQM